MLESENINMVYIEKSLLDDSENEYTDNQICKTVVWLIKVRSLVLVRTQYASRFRLMKGSSILANSFHVCPSPLVAQDRIRELKVSRPSTPSGGSKSRYRGPWCIVLERIRCPFWRCNQRSMVPYVECVCILLSHWGREKGCDMRVVSCGVSQTRQRGPPTGHRFRTTAMNRMHLFPRERAPSFKTNRILVLVPSSMTLDFFLDKCTYYHVRREFDL